MTNIVMISIDPGKTGAMVLWEQGPCGTLYVHEIIDLSTFVTGKRSFDFEECTKAMLPTKWDEIPIVIEDVHSSPMMGVASAFHFGFSACAVLACATLATGAPNVIRYSPQKWKGALGLMGKPKQASVDKVKKDYPYLIPYLKFKKYHDRADAVLIGKAFALLERKNVWV